MAGPVAWALLGAGSIGIHLWLGRDSGLAERFYSRGVFVALRYAWDNTLGYWPAPWIYTFLAAAVVWGVWRIVRLLRRRPGRRLSSVRTLIGRGTLRVAGWAGALVFFFYFLWGFNYDRVSLERQVGLEASPLDAAALESEAAWAAGRLAETRERIPLSGSHALGPGSGPANLEAEIRSCLSGILGNLGYPAPGRVRVRPLWSAGLLMRMSDTGFYFPFGCEGYTADGLLAFERPFTMSHEMVHAFGISDEGSANFLGFLACQASDEPVVRYSGYLAYWNYVFPELARASREAARKVAAGLPEGVLEDMKAERENWDRYRGPLRRISTAVYEQYLKSQGVREGIKSYNRFVTLLAAWRRRAG